MCIQTLNHLKQLKLTSEQAKKLEELQKKNKEAAKEQLLRIQLLCAKKPMRNS